MQEILKLTNIRQILTHEFQKRQVRNNAYTLRSFARDLTLAPSQISRLMNSRAGISTETARRISEKLLFDEVSTQHFLNLAGMEFSRSTVAHEASKEKILSTRSAFTPLNRLEFKTISEWYHLPLMCLTELNDFEEDSTWIAKRLKINKASVKPAIQRLIKLGMMKRDESGRLKITGDYFNNVEGLPSTAIRNYHRQMIGKAMDAIEEQNTQERFLSTLVLPVDDDEMVEAQIFIKQFLDEFKKKFNRRETQKKQVYALTLQYFGLTDLQDEVE